MADSLWELEKDGCYSLNNAVLPLLPVVSKVVYHSNLNVLLVLTKECHVLIVDVNTGQILRTILVRGSKPDGENQRLDCTYLNVNNRILFTDGYNLGLRSDYNGILLLDTILQTPVTWMDLTSLEIPVFEASLLVEAMKVAMSDSSCSHVHVLLSEIEKKLAERHSNGNSDTKSSKLEKWQVILIDGLAYSDFRVALIELITFLNKSSRFPRVLTIASSLKERLQCLLKVPYEHPDDIERNLMCSEARRRKTFTNWPHMDYKWALPDQMAQAGFYHQPSTVGDERDDRAMCFTCVVCLVSWEPTDEPWSEHERHSPSCPFIKGEYTPNVPLSVNYASAPAINVVKCIPGQQPLHFGTSSVKNLIPTFTPEGMVSLWNYSRFLKEELSVNVMNFFHDKDYYFENNFPHPDLYDDFWTMKSEGHRGDFEIVKMPEIDMMEHIESDRVCGGRFTIESACVIGTGLYDYYFSVYSEYRNQMGYSPQCEFGPQNEGYVPYPARPCLVVGISHFNTLAYKYRKGLKDEFRRIYDQKVKDSGELPQRSRSFLAVFDFAFAAAAATGEEDEESSAPKSPATAGDAATLKPKFKNDANMPAKYKMKPMKGTGTMMTRGSVKDAVLATAAGGMSKNAGTLPDHLYTSYYNKYEKNLFESMNSGSAFPLPDVVLKTLAHSMDSPTGSTYEAMQDANKWKHGADGTLHMYESEGTFTWDDTLNLDASYGDNGSSSVDNVEPPPAKKANKDDNKMEYGSSGSKIPRSVIPLHFIPIGLRQSNMAISGIYPILDGQHMLLLMKHALVVEDYRKGLYFYEEDGGTCYAVLLLYKLDLSNDAVYVQNEPKKVKVIKVQEDVPVDMVMLPTFMKRDETFIKDGYVPMGVAVTAKGELHLLNLITLEVVHINKGEHKYVSAAYCENAEKLCVCDDKALVHYFNIYNKVLVCTNSGEDEGATLEGMSMKLVQEMDESRDLLSQLPSFQLEDLKKLYTLTLFENLTPLFMCSTPACWTELKQAQKDRKCPQHLQKDARENHTRTWKLQAGRGTWDEHLFDITLPESVVVGHVDVKVQLVQTCGRMPDIQITLLRRKCAPCSGGKHRKKKKMKHGGKGSSSADSVDAKIDFAPRLDAKGRELGATINPVTTKEFHVTNKTELLCGPVHLSSYVDQNKKCGTASLTSPKLFAECCRSLLVHIKAVGPLGEETTSAAKADAKKSSNILMVCSGAEDLKTEKMLKEFMQSSEGPADYTYCQAKTSPKAANGCNWIQDLSITVRKPKACVDLQILNERMERRYMLESDDFAKNLLVDYMKNCNKEYRGIAMDLLIWVACIRLCRLRSLDFPRQRQLAFVQIIESELSELIRIGYVQGNRTLANKTTKLFLACSTGVKHAAIMEKVQFDASVLKEMTDWLPKMIECRSSGAFRWFFQLFQHFACVDKLEDIPSHCMNLLVEVAREINERRNPYHMLLRTRFGLYGNPFESELFEIEPLIQGEGISSEVTYASLVHGPNIVFNNMPEPPSSGFFSLLKPFDLKELTKAITPKPGVDGKVDATVVNSMSSYHYMKGLLEVEPLHFICEKHSDGTLVERMDFVADDDQGMNFYAPSTTTPVGVNYNSLMSSLSMAKEAMFAKKAGGEKFYVFHEGKGPNWGSNSYDSTYYQKVKLHMIPKFHKIQDGKIIVTDMGMGFQHTSSSGENKNIIFLNSPSDNSPNLQPPMYQEKDQPSTSSQSTDSVLSSNSPITLKNADLFPWQHLLAPPAQQMMIVDRLHSGAKRFVVLDFGVPIVLTDLVIPRCYNLLSLSIDIWVKSEEEDGKRLVVATDIGSRMLIMSNIQPPPICQYLKITVIGRYGMPTLKCCIPIGSYYGHSYIMPEDSYIDNATYFGTNMEVNQRVLMGIIEDIQCRYGIACSKLKELLNPYLLSEAPNSSHMDYFLNKSKLTPSSSLGNSQQNARIYNLYKDCIMYQHQLNMVESVLNRLSSADYDSSIITKPNGEEFAVALKQVCVNRLRVMCDTLLDLLLRFSGNLNVSISLYKKYNVETWSSLFNWLCISEDTRMQISACTLLAKLFGTHNQWGEFLVKIFAEYFSSGNRQIFPQDRVFVLMSYLSRKSILASGNQNLIVENVLKTLLGILQPLGKPADHVFVRSRVDVNLFSWTLLFFMQCVEVWQMNKGEEGEDAKPKDKRWNFIQSEDSLLKKSNTEKKAAGKVLDRVIHRKMLMPKGLVLDDSKGNFNSQRLEKLLDSKNAVLTKMIKESEEVWNEPNSSQKMISMKFKILIDKKYCVSVLRAIMSFLMQADVTCNVDLLIICCRVFSILLRISKESIWLGEIMTEEELLKLIHMATWCESGRNVVSGKWGTHALTCLLQDIVETVPCTTTAAVVEEAPLLCKETAPVPASFSAKNSSYASSSSNHPTTATKGCIVAGIPFYSYSSPENWDVMNHKVVQVLSEIVEKQKEFERKSIMGKFQVKLTKETNISTAMDARLELGLEESLYLLTRRICDSTARNLLKSINAAPTVFPWLPKYFSMDGLDEVFAKSAAGCEETAVCSSNVTLFWKAFDQFFYQLLSYPCSNTMEQGLQLYTSLAKCTTAKKERIPAIGLSSYSVSSIMMLLTSEPSPSVGLFNLTFEAITLTCSWFRTEAAEADAGKDILATVVDDSLINLMVSFLSQSCPGDMVGAAPIASFLKFMTKMNEWCKGNGKLLPLLHSCWLNVLFSLVQPGGAIADKRGPLDAQITFVEILQTTELCEGLDKSIISLVSGVAVLLKTYLTQMNTVKGCLAFQIPSNAAACFAVPTMKGTVPTHQSDDKKSQDPFTRSFLMVRIMKFLCTLISPTDDVCADENDLELGKGDGENTQKRILATLISQNSEAVIQLLDGLSFCYKSLSASHIEWNVPGSLKKLGIHSTVADALYHFLFILFRQTSDTISLARYACDFFKDMTRFRRNPNASFQLSEPLLWFTARVVAHSERELEEFVGRGGMQVVCENLETCFNVVLNPYPSVVSSIMKYLYGTHVFNDNVIVGRPQKRKILMERGEDGLVNFAPIGTIEIDKSNNGSCPEVLLASTGPHRRARAASWNYHFHPAEKWVEMKILLPYAILLREIHLQPHQTSLASNGIYYFMGAPSAVSIELCKDGMEYTPLDAPTTTNALQHIILSLYQPEVVTSVLVRCYRPRESSTLGLSQIKLMGQSAFWDGTPVGVSCDVPSDNIIISTTMCWLRLLDICVTASSGKGPVEEALLDVVARNSATVDILCGLLLLPAPLPQFFTASLERTLLKIGNHDDDLCLRIMNHVLASGTIRDAGVSDYQTNSMFHPCFTRLLHKFCSGKAENGLDRMKLLLEWLKKVAEMSIISGNVVTPVPKYVYSVGAIIWSSLGSSSSSDVKETDLLALLGRDFVELLWKWSESLSVNCALKIALDRTLSAVYCVKPSDFVTWMITMGLMVFEEEEENMEDYQAEGAAAGNNSDVSDDSKMAVDAEKPMMRLQSPDGIFLSKNDFATLAVVSQSTVCVQYMIDFGLLPLFANIILEFCRNSYEISCVTAEDSKMPLMHIGSVIAILKLLAELCWEGTTRQWLGTDEASKFWPILLEYLCRSFSFVKMDSAGNAVLSELEEATVEFFRKCCWCHTENQKKLAKILCNVITLDGGEGGGAQDTFLQTHNMKYNLGISDCMRRMLLQLVLENEKIYVSAHCDMLEGMDCSGAVMFPHLEYAGSQNHQLVYVDTGMTTLELLSFLVGLNEESDEKEGESEPSSGSGGHGDESMYDGSCISTRGIPAYGEDVETDDESMEKDAVFYTYAAGVKAKVKRIKCRPRYKTNIKIPGMTYMIDDEAQMFESMEVCKMSSISDKEYIMPFLTVFSPKLGTYVHAPMTMTVNKMLTMARAYGEKFNKPVLRTALVDRRIFKMADLNKDIGARFLTEDNFPTMLEEFMLCGGLVSVARNLPVVYPSNFTRLVSYTDAKGGAPSGGGSSSSKTHDNLWTKVDNPDEFYEEYLDESKTPCTYQVDDKRGEKGSPAIPPHSLIAFGQFMKLPNYAKLLVKDATKAQYMLRLILGGTDDVFYFDEKRKAELVKSLPTLPFDMLVQLFALSPWSRKDAKALRESAMNFGAMHVTLYCLALFTHQADSMQFTEQDSAQHETLLRALKRCGATSAAKKMGEKSGNYWAKGTGYGTGNTLASWNVEQALSRKKVEEEHVTIFLKILKNFIDPSEECVEILTLADKGRCPPSFVTLVQQSCLLPCLNSYLRNDSVMDMSRHVPLYNTILSLLRAMACSPELMHFLLPLNEEDAANARSLLHLMNKMSNCVGVYAAQVATRDPTVITSGDHEMENEEDFTLLIENIQWTLTAITNLCLESDCPYRDSLSKNYAPRVDCGLSTLEDKYLKIMKEMQFATSDMVCDGERGLKFTMSYHFENQVKSDYRLACVSRMKRLAQEAISLSTSLPLSFSSTVFVRCDTARMDIMKVLITGPAETPYSNGCFEFDVYFPPEYPSSPMLINLETTGRHQIRFNPNLYNDGKVCLSVLNTWHGRPEEKWNSQTSSFLQVLVSIQSLILVPEPYFNEPGYERSRGTPSGNLSSREYNANIMQATVRWAMIEQMRSPSLCFKEIVEVHFWLKKKEIVDQVKEWIIYLESDLEAGKKIGKNVAQNLNLLKSHYNALYEELSKLPVPSDLEDMKDMPDVALPPNVTANGTSGSKSSAAAAASGAAPSQQQEEDPSLYVKNAIAMNTAAMATFQDELLAQMEAEEAEMTNEGEDEEEVTDDDDDDNMSSEDYGGNSINVIFDLKDVE